MGNSSGSGFKGKGNVLGGDGSTATSAGANTSSSSSSSSKNRLPSLAIGNGAGLLQTKKKVPVINAQEAEAKRALQAKKALERNNAWEARISKQRNERLAKEKLDREPEAKISNNASIAFPENTPIDQKLAEKLKAEAKALETSGFNPFKADISSSGNARAAITLDDMNNTSAAAKEIVKMGGKGIDVDRPMVKKAPIGNSNSSSSNNNNNNNIDWNSELSLAISKSDVERIKEIQSKYKSALDPNLFREASDLITALKTTNTSNAGNTSENVDIDDIYDDTYDPVAASQAASDVDDALSRLLQCGEIPEEREKILTSCKTLRTILENLLQHPEEPKFRKIRVANKVLQTRIVEPANGASLDVLKAIGFKKDVIDGEEVFIVPDPASLPSEMVELGLIVAQHAIRRLDDVINVISN